MSKEEEEAAEELEREAAKEPEGEEDVDPLTDMLAHLQIGGNTKKEKEEKTEEKQETHVSSIPDPGFVGQQRAHEWGCEGGGIMCSGDRFTQVGDKWLCRGCVETGDY